jgi:hypothetical protein
VHIPSPQAQRLLDLTSSFTFVGKHKNIPSIPFKDFTSAAFQEHFQQQQSLLVLYFQDDHEKYIVDYGCDDNEKCRAILAQLSQLYSTFAAAPLGGEAEVAKERRLATETILVNLEDPEDEEEARRRGWIGQVPNHNTSSWDRSRNEKVVKYTSIFLQHFRYMKLMQNEALASINGKLDHFS